MDNGYNIIPEHIRENLKKYSPNITENFIICLECGYHGQMCFTIKRNRDFGSFLTSGFGGSLLLAFY